MICDIVVGKMMDFLFLKNMAPPIIGEGNLKICAVAVALTEEDDVILEVRSGKLGHQPGDICLPGGGVESGETPEQAAVREMTEELLIDESDIRVLGPSSIFVTGMLAIHSFVCRVSSYSGSFQMDEVEEILRVPLAFFLGTKPEIHEISWHPDIGEDFPFDKIYGGRRYAWREHRSRIRFYEYDGHVIWGITARILEAFAQSCHQNSLQSGDNGSRQNCLAGSLSPHDE